MPYHTFCFANGLRMIFMPVDCPVAWCGLAVNAGTRDERPDSYGLAHFVEHMLFKGTVRRKAWHILNRMDSVGGELNAYTTKEETVVYSVFMAAHMKRAMELLADVVFNSCFPKNEVEKEKEVILDEIRSYEDAPAELIFDLAENMIYAGHALEHNILGTQADIRTFDATHGAAFMKQYYTPSNMVLFVMGRIPKEEVINTAQSIFGHLSMSNTSLNRTPPTPIEAISRTIGKNTHQAHVLMGARAYSMSDPLLPSLCLLNNVLGGPGMNSLLNISLREKAGLVYNIEAGMQNYTDTGWASIYFGTDPLHLDRALGLVNKTLKDLREIPLTDARMKAAKKQITGQLAIADENREGTFLAMGKSFLHHNKYEPLDKVLKRIDTLSARQLQETANQIYAPDSIFTLSFI